MEVLIYTYCITVDSYFYLGPVLVPIQIFCASYSFSSTLEMLMMYLLLWRPADQFSNMFEAVVICSVFFILTNFSSFSLLIFIFNSPCFYLFFKKKFSWHVLCTTFLYMLFCLPIVLTFLVTLSLL